MIFKWLRPREYSVSLPTPALISRYVLSVGRAVQHSPLVGFLLSRFPWIVRTYFIILTEYKYRTNFKSKRIHPRKRYYTNPERITKLLAPNTPFSVKNAGEVHDGSWDTQSRSFAEYRIYQSLRKRFTQDSEWMDTAQLQQAVQRVQSGESCWHGCTSVEDLEDRCSYLDSVYENIKTDGYKPQSELEVRRDENASPYPPSLREISVAIGRNGELILVDGRHRLSIAKLLDIDQIPIQIAIIHTDWDGGLPAGVSATASSRN